MSRMRPWTTNDPRWQSLPPEYRPVAMAYMETGGNPAAMQNVMAAMHNRAARAGVPVHEQVSQPIYQPAIEPSQQARLDQYLKHPQFNEHLEWSRRYAGGQVQDPTNGATHFLVPERTMLSLQQREPDKYKSWNNNGRGGGWTGYDPRTQQYNNPDGSPVFRDRTHAFLAPEGRHSLWSGEAAPGATEPLSPIAAPNLPQMTQAAYAGAGSVPQAQAPASDSSPFDFIAPEPQQVAQRAPEPDPDVPPAAETPPNLGMQAMMMRGRERRRVPFARL